MVNFYILIATSLILTACGGGGGDGGLTDSPTPTPTPVALSCGVDEYDVSGTCTPVGNGYFSADGDGTRTQCTNLAPNATANTYSSSGGGVNNCTIDTITGCVTDFHLSGGACVAVGIGNFSANGDTSITACTNTTPNASSITYTSSGNGANNCSFTINSCDATYHIEGALCLPDTRSATVANGTGTETWNGVGYDLTITGCNTDFYESGGACVAVGNGFFSANGDVSRTACTNSTPNATSVSYSGSGGGVNSCPFTVSGCGVDYYRDTPTTCSQVSIGFYSADDNIDQNACTNANPSNASNIQYTSRGGGSNNCSFTFDCDTNYEVNGAGTSCRVDHLYIIGRDGISPNDSLFAYNPVTNSVITVYTNATTTPNAFGMRKIGNHLYFFARGEGAASAFHNPKRINLDTLVVENIGTIHHGVGGISSNVVGSDLWLEHDGAIYVILQRIDQTSSPSLSDYYGYEIHTINPDLSVSRLTFESRDFNPPYTYGANESDINFGLIRSPMKIIGDRIYFASTNLDLGARRFGYYDIGDNLVTLTSEGFMSGTYTTSMSVVNNKILIGARYSSGGFTNKVFNSSDDSFVATSLQSNILFNDVVIGDRTYIPSGSPRSFGYIDIESAPTTFVYPLTDIQSTFDEVPLHFVKSTDETKIYFVAEDNVTPGQVFVYDVAANDVALLSGGATTTLATDVEFYRGQPVWASGNPSVIQYYDGSSTQTLVDLRPASDLDGIIELYNP